MSLLDNPDFGVVSDHFKGPFFRNPTVLAVRNGNWRRGLLLGSCFLQLLSRNFPIEYDEVLYNGRGVPALPRPLADYDVVVVHVPLRHILLDDPLWRDPESVLEQRFQDSLERLTQALAGCFGALAEAAAPVFVMNFIVPTLDPGGRFMRRGRYRNPQFMIGGLNEALEHLCHEAGAHILDVNEILNSYGKRYFTDEATAWYAHGSVMVESTDPRMEPVPSVTWHYDTFGHKAIGLAIAAELFAQLRILAGIDRVKMVVVDLDDTLWRGVLGDAEQWSPSMVEGWPMGVAEALGFCKQRGILLGILSKNEETLVRQAFPVIFRNLLTLADFTTWRIGWDDKTAGMAAILQETNLLPEHVLFIDDNPVERARMAEAFPLIRVMGRHFLYTRHTLLNAPEMQVPVITAESAQRTEMVQAQIRRDQARETMDAEAFLRAQGVHLRLGLVDVTGGALVERAMELINKTNQWNSTGERVDLGTLAAAAAAGEQLLAGAVEDRFTAYGQVIFVRFRGPVVAQLVMSCRVVGMRIEHAVLAHLLERLGVEALELRFIATDRNMPFASFWRQFSDNGQVSRDHLGDIGHIHLQVDS